MTGALSIADWWYYTRSSRPRQTASFRLVWSIRERSMEQVQEVQDLQDLMRSVPNMEFSTHVSSAAGRLGVESELNSFLDSREPRNGKAWVYVSGPEGLLASVEAACVKGRRSLQSTETGKQEGGITRMDWFIARWSL